MTSLSTSCALPGRVTWPLPASPGYPCITGTATTFSAATAAVPWHTARVNASCIATIAIPSIYPRICPAVIVAVRHGDKLLVSKYAGREYKNIALLAGFAEVGETIEETVHREVMEEVGIKVKNLQFYKSQPWCFTDTLLFGFFCDLDGDDTLKVDHGELATAGWIDRQDIPEDTEKASLTMEMMTLFKQGVY